MMQDSTEIWKDVKDFEGYYKVSNKGRIKSLKRSLIKSNGSFITIPEKILKPHLNTKGYLTVCLCDTGFQKVAKIHRLVATAFIEGDRTLEVNHKNGNKQDNSLSNLEWATTAENKAHAVENNLIARLKGADNSQFKGTVLVFKNGKFITELNGSEDMKGKGFVPSCVCRCLNGQLKSHRGCTFKRI